MPKQHLSGSLPSSPSMIRLIVRVCSVPSSKRWDWTRKLINREWYKRVSPMPRIIWSLPRGMLPIKRLTKEIWLPRCLLSVISILVIGTDAVRRERWILMIYWYIPIFCFVTFRKCWHVIAISSVMYWWTSIRIRIMRSIALFCN